MDRRKHTLLFTSLNGMRFLTDLASDKALHVHSIRHTMVNGLTEIHSRNKLLGVKEHRIRSVSRARLSSVA